MRSPDISFETLYHGTTTDRLEAIASSEVLPMHRIDTGMTGVWMTRLVNKSAIHAVERGSERGGLEPVVLEFVIPSEWTERANSRPMVDKMSYDDNVFCFTEAVPLDFWSNTLHFSGEPGSYLIIPPADSP